MHTLHFSACLSARFCRFVRVIMTASAMAFACMALLPFQTSSLLAAPSPVATDIDTASPLDDHGESLDSDAIPTAASPKEQGPMIYLPLVYGKERDLAEVLAETGQYSTFLQVLEATEQLELLHGEGPITLLAPTDAAFDALPQGALEQLLAQLARNPEGQLYHITRYHILPGAYSSSDFTDGRSIETLQGADVYISVHENDVYVNGVEIVERDLSGSNGLIHGLAAVILPPVDHQ